MFPTTQFRTAAWLTFVLLAVILIVSCGGSEIDDYFSTADPVFDSHSDTMAAAETSLFEVSRLDDGGGLSFGADVVPANRLLPIFSETAVSVEHDIAAWDEIDFPDSAGEYHSLTRLAMSLRLQAMLLGEQVLEQIAQGQVLEDPFVGPENAMADANAVLVRALDEANNIRP